MRAGLKALQTALAGRRRRQVGAATSFVALLAVTASLAPTSSAADGTTSARADATAFSAAGRHAAASHDGNARVIDASHARNFTLDTAQINAQLPDGQPATRAAARSATSATATDTSVVSLPAPDGSTQDFRVAPVEVMAPGLAAQHPEIQTFAGKGLDDAGSSVRITQSPLGFQASVRGGDLGFWYIDPTYHRDQSLYSSYYGDKLANRHGPLEESGVEPSGESDASALRAATNTATAGRGLSNGDNLRTYRLALASDPGYATYFGAANVTAAKVALINRVDQVYEDELAIRLVLIAQNDDLNLDTDAEMIAPNGPCGASACYTRDEESGCSGDTLDANRIAIDQIVGAENFDIGHLALGRDGGGIAGLGVVGTALKAEGCTGLEKPDGDFYAVDYVAHEMGHQFGGNHTFNGDDANCSGNGVARSAVEPGSGSSIMAYAGICGQDNLQPHSDPYFSERSFTELTSYVRSNQDPVDEVQTAALTHFGGGNEVQSATFGIGFKASASASASTSSFKLQIGGIQTVKIGGSGGVAFTNSAIQTALNNALANPSSTLPSGTTVTVTNTSTTLGTFNVTFGGASANTDVPNIQIVGLAGCSACFSSIEETRHGGTPDSFKLSYGANTSGTITFGGNYTTSGIASAINSILPAGATVTVDGFGGNAFNQSGFEVIFHGNLNKQPVPNLLAVTNLTAGASAKVSRTDLGGPAANKGNAITATGNTPPVVTAPKTHTIPDQTPFKLSGSATDADSGDTLTYMWEQTDRGNAESNLVDPHKVSGPLFRQFGVRLDDTAYEAHVHDFNTPGENHTTTDPSRTFPDLTQILANNTNARTGRCPGAKPPSPPSGSATNVRNKLIDCDSEFLPTSLYRGPMHFRLTARDGHVGGGGVASADTTVELAKGTGPFLVKFPNEKVKWKSHSSHTVHWDVAGTSGKKIKARKVKISLSTDGGLTYPTTLTTTKNDGAQKVRLPNVTSNQARIRISAVGNVFFDVSDADFKIGG